MHRTDLSTLAETHFIGETARPDVLTLATPRPVPFRCPEPFEVRNVLSSDTAINSTNRRRFELLQRVWAIRRPARTRRHPNRPPCIPGKILQKCRLYGTVAFRRVTADVRDVHHGGAALRPRRAVSRARLCYRFAAWRCRAPGSEAVPGSGSTKRRRVVRSATRCREAVQSGLASLRGSPQAVALPTGAGLAGRLLYRKGVATVRGA